MLARIVLWGVVALACGVAQAESTLRVRGTITAVDAGTLSVKSREGRDLKLRLPENASVAVAKAIKFEEIKAGDYVGVTSIAGPEGARVAVEVHYLAPTTPPGQLAWDLQPNSSMSNANVGATVIDAGRRELTLQSKEGPQRILVPDGIPLVRAVPGTRADLVPGEYIFTVAQVADDGTITAPRIQVSKDGVRPPQ